MTAFARALDSFEEVVREVPSDRWTAPSPCEGWTARDVAGHTVGGLQWATALIIGADALPSMPDVAAVGPGVLAGADPLATWIDARGRLQAACHPEALRRRVRWPFGEQTVDQGLDWFSLEVMVHAWDLGRATGIAARLDPAAVHDHLVRIRPIAGHLRGSGMYGAERQVRGDADEQDQLLALLGRGAV